MLVGACEEYRADLVVIGAVSRGALQRLALGSTAERVLDFVPCDLLIVNPDRARS
ncbi:Universal stress protein E [compost metagenome]